MVARNYWKHYVENIWVIKELLQFIYISTYIKNYRIKLYCYNVSHLVRIDVTIDFDRPLRDAQWIWKNFQTFHTCGQQSCTMFHSVNTGYNKADENIRRMCVTEIEVVCKWGSELLSHCLPSLLSTHFILYL